MTMGLPTGASSNMSIARIPARVVKPLITRLLEVLMRVTELDRMEQNASGSRNLLGEILARSATPTTMGRKKAVHAVLLTKALRPAAESIITPSKMAGRLPA